MHRQLKPIVRPLRALPMVVRVGVGVLLVVGGLLGALPVLGFWMVPLGLLVLSVDFRWARRGYLGIMVWFRNRRACNRGKRKGDSS